MENLCSELVYKKLLNYKPNKLEYIVSVVEIFLWVQD